MFEMTFLKNQHEEYEALAQIAEMESAEIHHKMLPSGMEPITMTNDLSREICENYTDPIAPKTNKSVLLERWAKDTRELAKLLVDSRYDAIIRAYTMQDGSLCWEYDHALEAEIAYLNSAEKSDEKCPICEYAISGCQCIYSGSAHPDRHDKKRVVIDHLYLLSPTQVQHVISLEKHWQISYADEILNAIMKKLIANSPYTEGANQ